MEQENLDKVCSLARKKMNFIKNPSRYFIYAFMAGGFCSLGMAIAYTMGSEFYASESLRGAYKLVVGTTFTFAFTMIVFAGSELFTGNVFTMTVAVLSKKARISNALYLLSFCYAANVVGAVAFGLLFSATGLLSGQTGDFFLNAAIAKMSIPFCQAFFRGVLCNVMVCLGVWAGYKTKSETARMILYFWVIYAFVGTGYEHCIANAGLFTMALRISPAHVTVSSVMSNIIPSTLGNLAGGSLLVGWTYWFSCRDSQKTVDLSPVGQESVK